MRHLAVLLPIALLLAACGGSSDEPASGDVLQTIQISENEFSLNPSMVTLQQAGTYEFEVTNDGQITHAFEIEESGGGAEEETGNIAAGETKTVRFTFSAEGSYEMYCPIGDHADQGMRGTIVVGSAAGGADTTTDEDETTTGGTTTDGGPGY
jgi:PQQ system protein